MNLIKNKEQKKLFKDVDHNSIDYLNFRKNLYIESSEISNLTANEIEQYRQHELKNVMIKGKKCPRPIKLWKHCGLNQITMNLLQKYNYLYPFPIQCQCIPAIMSGRDLIAIAQTGSGKSLAFILPMIRHILDQPALNKHENGPIALIMVPTRELCIQLKNEVNKFASYNQLHCVALYGGGSLAIQIANLKRGAHIVCCTPGRLIDLLTANNGKVINLKRCTFLVLDEADRMFDLGFKPQIIKIIKNIRPDRQSILFSATFPSFMESIAYNEILNNQALQITIGSKLTATSNIRKIIEVIYEQSKFTRLLELLNIWYNQQDDINILIFESSIDMVNELAAQLNQNGYPCLSLHANMSQQDRSYTF